MKIAERISIGIVFIATTLLCSCEKEEPISVTTSPVKNISMTLAFGGGEISGDHGLSITARGVCWSLSPAPTLSDDHTVDEGGNGSFTSTLSGLAASEIYYVRAYATSPEGTVYGEEVEFDNTWGDSGTFVDSRDGAREYKWVRIGTQIWMAENLAYLPSLDPPAVGSLFEPCYYVYDNMGSDVISARSSEYYKLYGALYNWTAAILSCPKGWHLPGDLEWNMLEGFADSQYSYGQSVWFNDDFRGFDAGINLKATSGWQDFSGTDLCGFSALPGGDRNLQGFYGAGMNSLWWTSSENIYMPGAAYIRGLASINNYQVWRSYETKELGLSVRCVMNY